MNFYDASIEEYEDIQERYELMLNRIREIPEEKAVTGDLYDYFTHVSSYVNLIDELLHLVKDGTWFGFSREEKTRYNDRLYGELKEGYKTSFLNYEYTAGLSGMSENGWKYLTFLYTEMRGLICCAHEGKIVDITLYLELFVEIYSMICAGAGEDEIHLAIYYFMNDYAEYFMTNRVAEQLDSELTFAVDIIMKSDLDDLSYLYDYGEYIGRNELELAAYLNTMSNDEIESIAATYTAGFKRGFEAMHIDMSQKKSVDIRYSIGQERIVKAAIGQFLDMGLSPICHRYAWNRINRRLMNRQGYVATSPNKQYDYDHRMDEALFLDKALCERKLEVLEAAYKKYEYQAAVYAGPACIEIFGELPFVPVNKKANPVLTKKQQEISVGYVNESSQIVNTYIPGDKYSFTIIAYPVPEIGDNFREIFRETIRINNLDNGLFRKIQQSIIDELDTAEYVRVIGRNGNRTDMTVMLHELKDPDKETKFENCVADVNIPVGEVFTSPKLTGTNGTLNVSEVYLNDLKYIDLELRFTDGMISDYSCKNFDSEDENRSYIRENLLMNQTTLPIGEFAIGTNTTAYVIANKYDIVYKLPILIVEKMGPHFAVGDTCYSHSEENAVYNPDGKEIIARENECSMLRHTDISKAYFNCHTDITIPYDEVGRIYTIHADHTETDIIKEGRFVLPGTCELNKAFTL